MLMSPKSSGGGIKPIVTEDQRLIHKLTIILQEFQKVDETISLQLCITFLLVAQNEGCSLTDIWKQTGWVQSTVTRHLLDLGQFNRQKGPGYNLVQSERDPMELRKNIYTLTPKGKALYKKLVEMMKL